MIQGEFYGKFCIVLFENISHVIMLCCSFEHPQAIFLSFGTIKDTRNVGVNDQEP